MVHLTTFLLRINQENLGKYLNLTFIDKLRVCIKSGNGGHGFAPKGGTGGNGGSIYFKGKEGLTLKETYQKNLKKRYLAEHGEQSKRIKLYGSDARDLVIDVPIGISVVTDNDISIGEINKPDEQLLVLKGGKGGNSSNNYKSTEGKKLMVNLDLKLLAEVGLVGFPNAGKSTLLSLISRASPRIANYPFTTLKPQLGLIEFEDKRRISVADMPGVIEGSHYNRGMGQKFLKHISRCKINLFVIDINGFQLSSKYQTHSAFQTLIFLNKELELYNSRLLEKKNILVLNKMDTETSSANYEEFEKLFDNYLESIQKVEDYWKPLIPIKFEKVYKISAKENSNVDLLCQSIREIIDNLDEQDRSEKKMLEQNILKLENGQKEEEEEKEVVIETNKKEIYTGENKIQKIKKIKTQKAPENAKCGDDNKEKEVNYDLMSVDEIINYKKHGTSSLKNPRNKYPNRSNRNTPANKEHNQKKETIF